MSSAPEGSPEGGVHVPPLVKSTDARDTMAMSAAPDLDESPVFAHHVRAALARQRQADRDLLGPTLRRAKYRTDDGGNENVGGRAARTGSSTRIVNFYIPSPLTGRDRQSGGIRIPHFDMKPCRASFVPTSATGKVHHRYTQTHRKAGDHVDYVIDGAWIAHSTHLDYLWRDLPEQDRDSGMIMDALDERDLRDHKNALRNYSNIDGGRGRQRSLFDAAERCEQKPRIHELVASTDQFETWDYVARLGDTPGWFRIARDKLRAAKAKAEAKAKPGEMTPPVTIPVAKVTSEQAFEYLTWLDERPGTSSDLVKFKQGKTGRSHYRFVGELPAGLNRDRQFAVVKLFCDRLARDGWMFVAAIHEPDPHTDRRNPHFHVDGYDRPSAWLEDHDCWDFEYSERRNGKVTFPYRHNKVRYPDELNPKGKLVAADTATIMRRRYIEAVNDIVGDRPDIPRYVHGTYADHGIRLSPLEHAGNAAIAAEFAGVETPVGTRNAQRIIRDDLAAYEREAAQKRAALSVEVARLRTIHVSAGTQIDEYQAIKHHIIDRELQAELADYVIGLSRSRAEAVIRRRGDNPAVRRPAPSPPHDDLLRAAKAHLASIDEQSPSDGDRESERRKLVSLRARASQVKDAIAAASPPKAEREMSAPIELVAGGVIYRARRSEQALTPIHNQAFRDLMLKRLENWLTKHAQNPAKVAIDDRFVILGNNVPDAIDTLLRRFSADQRIQTLLKRERDRRIKLNQAKLEPALAAPDLIGGTTAPAAVIGAARSAGKSPTSSDQRSIDPPAAKNRERIQNEHAGTNNATLVAAELRRDLQKRALSRSAGFGPARGLPRVPGLPSLGLDDRSKATEGILLDPARNDIRGRQPADLSVRSQDGSPAGIPKQAGPGRKLIDARAAQKRPAGKQGSPPTGGLASLAARVSREAPVAKGGQKSIAKGPERPQPTVPAGPRRGRRGR